MAKNSRERRKFLRTEHLLIKASEALGHHGKREISLSWLINSRAENERKKRLLKKLNPKKYRGTSLRSKPEVLHPIKGKESGADNGDDNIGRGSDSSEFIKETQSKNPHNDYCQHFVDTKLRPQNFIHDVSMKERFEEYPKLRELIERKDNHINKHTTPPLYMKCDLSTFNLSHLGTKFDVIYLTPPLEEYKGRYCGYDFTQQMLDFEEVMKLKIEDIAATRSFVFVWVGSGEGLDAGRECLRKWGFRRCEDIVWIKTNKKQGISYLEPKSIFQSTKEHCLMGIKGTVKRNQDGNFIHSNVDLDVIVSEEKEYGDLSKPEELFRTMEHFCLGKRRLHIFGDDTETRPGWVTIGPALSGTTFNPRIYASYFEKEDALLLPFDERIEELRPKSPPPKAGGRGRGGGGQTMQSAPPPGVVQTKHLVFPR